MEALGWFLSLTLLQFEASPKHKTEQFLKEESNFWRLLRPLTTSHCLHALSSALKQHFLEYKIIWRRRSAIVGCYLRSRNVALDSLRKKQKDRHRGFFFVNKTRQREIAIFLWTELLYNHHGNFLLFNATTSNLKLNACTRIFTISSDILDDYQICSSAPSHPLTPSKKTLLSSPSPLNFAGRKRSD